ncbi:MAG: polyketide cyclase [Actinomycetota bacterium]|nr:polyketide cyclase [Actinomycetota bacterium]
MVPAGRDKVFSTLRRLETYPFWWPEVKELSLKDDVTAEVRIRAALPYSLRISMSQAFVDEKAGVLIARLQGDLEGCSSWRIEGGGDKTRCLFEEDVVVNKRLMKILAPIARPLFKLNHGLMMLRGRRGLRRYLKEQGE